MIQVFDFINKMRKCMLAFFLISSAAAGMAGYAGSGSSSGNYVGSEGGGYGYAGSFGGQYPQNFPNVPQFPAFPNFDFNSLLSQYFDNLRKYHQEFVTNVNQGQQGYSGYGYPGGFSGYGSPGYGGAASSASFGPQGVHQTAGVYPENPNNPNVNTRFGQAPSGDGSYGVFVSSQSATSDVDGKPVNFHQASTTVNDNGKVTTYTVRNP